MSIILAEAEKGRLINVFQAFAMNIYESLLTCLQKSDGFIMSMYYGGVIVPLQPEPYMSILTHNYKRE